MSSVPAHLTRNFFESLPMLRQPFRQTLIDLKPDCIVTGSFLHWTYYVAAELGIPRLVFDGSSFFSQCAIHSLLDRHNDLNALTDGIEPFVELDLPHRVKILKSQIPSTAFLFELMRRAREAEEKSYGVVVNSFYELEPDYAGYYRNVVGKRAWHIGPMSLRNQETRGSNESTMKWLDGKRSGSVVYVCFGSLSSFSAHQLRELALGLEASGRPFVWAMRRGGEDAGFQDFERRVEGRGLILRGWAPQILILNHRAVGGFLTHCGWNSCLEGISAGLPFLTWSLFADQVYNERLIVDVLRIGISIREAGFSEGKWPAEVEAAAVESGVKKLMGGDEGATERRRRVKELVGVARAAVEKGGSSYVDLSNLIQGLEEIKGKRTNEK